MEAAAAAAVILAVAIMVAAAAISVAGIMAAAIFTVGRRISVRSPAIVHSLRAGRSRHTVRSPRNARISLGPAGR
jgi:HAMP domain-containing protein